MNVEKREDKQILTYEKDVDMGLLMKELYEAIPDLAPVIIGDAFTVNMRMFTNGSTLTLWIPAEIAKDSVDRVVNIHLMPVEEGGVE